MIVPVSDDLGYSELLADGLRRGARDLTMSRHGGSAVKSRVVPDAVLGALPDLEAPVVDEMSQELATWDHARSSPL